MPAKILVIEADLSVASGLRKELKAEGYDVTVDTRGDEGLHDAQNGTFDLVIAELRLAGISGLDLVSRLHSSKPKLPIILMTGFGTPEAAIQATKLGACEYVLKPFEMPELLSLVVRSLEHKTCIYVPKDHVEPTPNSCGIVGTSQMMQEVYKEIGRACRGSASVLLEGETGCGKELVARAIHQYSIRSDLPFIAVNCAAIPEMLLESDLFGHERGSFTGAETRRIGRFEQARGGTIFLDEIGDLTLNVQVKLLRVLQEKQFQRVGGNETLNVTARIVAATHINLENAIKMGRFREDLFYRISALTIHLPPLSRHLEDIPELVDHFLHRLEIEEGMDPPSIQLSALEFLQNQIWPGNIRQLQNVLRHASLLAGPRPISTSDVEQAYRPQNKVRIRNRTIEEYFTNLFSAENGEAGDLHARMIEDMERELFMRAIRWADGNQAKAARLLGVTRTTMREKLIHFDLYRLRSGESFLIDLRSSDNSSAAR